jgi:hypothetical protein
VTDEFEQHRPPVASLVAGTAFLHCQRFSELIGSAILIYALTTQAKAAEPPLWVLIGGDGHMGPTITYGDTARDADTHVDEGLPTFTTAVACRAALRHVIKKYAGKSHAEGNYGSFLCVNYSTMVKGQ